MNNELHVELILLLNKVYLVKSYLIHHKYMNDASKMKNTKPRVHAMNQPPIYSL